MFNFFRRRKRKSDPEKISPAQGPGSQDKDKNTSDPNPTVCLDGPQQVIVMPFLHQPPERLQPRLNPIEVLNNFEKCTLDLSVSPLIQGIEGLQSLLQKNYVLVFLAWADSSICAFGFAPGMRHEIKPAALEIGYAVARDQLEGFFRQGFQRLAGTLQ